MLLNVEKVVIVAGQPNCVPYGTFLKPTPIWHNPLAAAANSASRPSLIFQAVTEKVPLTPGRGGAGEANIVMVNN
jgi:hypothetical protein